MGFSILHGFIGKFIICLPYIFWDMTRQENNNLIYPLQFASVRKKMSRLLYLQNEIFTTFFHVLAEKGYVDNLTVPQ